MEVHHHSHTAAPDSHRGRKKWTHYFWEFLMLFLAVFCGFLAENEREHFIEHKREKQYAKTLSADLMSNVSILNDALKEINFVIARIDTFLLLVHTKAIDEIPSGTWYYYGRFGTRNPIFSLHEATLRQLLNSGGLRYFKNQNVVQSITEYEQAVSRLKQNIELELSLDNDIVKARNQLFDAYYLNEIMNPSVSYDTVISFKQKSFPLLTRREIDFIQYANFCQLRSHDQKYIENQMQDLLRINKELLALLKEEYRLK
ncbi:MAG TPA: hypothetical protein VI548_11680 [Chitinophagaceae bacterium]|nr:hypothetical protein [Chitinophagaceae bacterium]